MKILLVYASVGMGHKKSAEAIIEAFKEIDRSDIDVSLIDSLEYTHPFFKLIYKSLYLYVVERHPYIWSFFYYTGGFRWLRFWISRGRRIINELSSKKFSAFLKSEQPDFIISTHFFPSEVVSHLKSKKSFHGKLVTAITDFSLHSFWITPNVDFFVVASENVKDILVKKGIDESKIKVLGIPISLAFRRVLNDTS